MFKLKDIWFLQCCFSKEHLKKLSRYMVVSNLFGIQWFGFNIGINDSKDAGQTIPHCHIHLIPRRKGDVENPRGGVRRVIPSKQNY